MEFLCSGAHLPRHSYQDKPDLPFGNMAVIRSKDSKHWEAVTDLRGQIGYRVSDGSLIHIDSLEALPASVTLSAPQQVTDTWNGDRWIAARPALANATLNRRLPLPLKYPLG